MAGAGGLTLRGGARARNTTDWWALSMMVRDDQRIGRHAICGRPRALARAGDDHCDWRQEGASGPAGRTEPTSATRTVMAVASSPRLC